MKTDLLSKESWCILDYLKKNEFPTHGKLFLNALKTVHYTEGHRDNIVKNPHRPNLSAPEFRSLIDKLMERGFIEEVEPYQDDKYQDWTFYAITEDGEEFIETVEEHVDNIDELRGDDRLVKK